MKKIIVFLLSIATVIGAFYLSPFYVVNKQNKELMYYVLPDDTVKIYEYTGKENSVTIPKKIDNKKVSSIAEQSIGYKEVDGEKQLIDNFVINGYPNTIANEYAVENNISFNCLHSFKTTITTKSTYAKEGAKLYSCSCGYSYTEVLPKLEIPKVNLKSVSANGLGVLLEWESIDGLDGYMIYRKTASGDYEKISTVSNETSYTDTAATSGEVSKYYVLGYAGDNVGKINSSELSVDYLEAPIFKLNSAKKGMKIIWTKCDNVSGYYIYRKDNSTGEWTQLKQITNPNTLEFVDSDVKKKVEYTYTMKSYDAEGKESAFLQSGKTLQFGEKAKVVYLTFDDGPSNNTPKILRILKKYGAKATFFVTANGKTKYMKTIVKSGNAIALHTYSHDYKKIYSSVSSFMNDLTKIHDLVEKETGVDAKVIRFPGGASNTISASYSKGIMSKLTKIVENEGYHYFDWNVSSGDAEGDEVAASKLLRNVKNDTGSQTTVCVLMHDTEVKKTTVKALPAICEYYISKGYEFDILTEDSPVCHQNVNN